VDEAALRPAPIDGDRAYSYLKQICALGPRPAGSEANAKQRKMVADHFTRLGGTVREQPFSATDPLSGQPVAMANLIGSWFPERTDRVLICAHYDTRPHPDQEQTPEGYNRPFLGANDGASGVALLMEIAHHLKDLPTRRGVDLVLLDGEELVYGHTGEYFLGSKAFAQAYARGRRGGKAKSRSRYSAGILLDMVGGRDLTIKREPYSVKLAPRLVEEVWTVARRIGAKSFRREFGREVLDDHLALNDGGIPTIDLIDFDYPHWHLASDLPEQCSGASLAEVGRVVTAWLALPRRK
jgi:Zn-dependent M28 family amino/carboxypeptidase